MRFFDGLTFAQLAWLSPIVYALHYAEEGSRLVEWFHNHYPMKGFQYDQRKLNLENILLFGLTLGMVILLNVFPESVVLRVLVFSSAIGFVQNAWFHIKPTLTTGVYSPGVVTASMFNLWLFLAYVVKLERTGALTSWFFLIAVVAGTAMLPLVVTLTHKVVLSRFRGWAWLERFPLPARPVKWKLTYNEPPKER